MARHALARLKALEPGPRDLQLKGPVLLGIEGPSTRILDAPDHFTPFNGAGRPWDKSSRNTLLVVYLGDDRDLQRLGSPGRSRHPARIPEACKGEQSKRPRAGETARVR